MSEETRAAAYRASTVRRAAAQAGFQTALRGSASARAALYGRVSARLLTPQVDLYEPYQTKLEVQNNGDSQSNTTEHRC